MRPFWIHSGLSLLDVDEHGGLTVTDEFLAAYLQRPELAPVDESCDGERALHAALLAAPRMAIDDARLAAIADAYVRENWRLFLRFRERLLEAPTLQAAYMKLFADARQAAQSARVGGGLSGFLTGNTNADVSAWDPLEQGFIELLQTADPAAFDASDQMPAEVGAGTFWTEGTSFVNGDEDAQAATDNIESSWP